ncbi:ABC transporter ATP-binding protein [Cumulibacter soli]|uniref:ABC transporter ATP-binding protein n=1 Tax=Cumulibacter soli TaxID=2546344 RepID=UPI0010677DEE|nr:ATP-binding cassette domain-containing protein [Cumulibacter soli]
MSTAISTKPAIHVRGLRKSFGDVEVLRDLDLDIPQGSVLALLGSNGAGKTTLIRILSTLIPADSGTTTVCGHDLDAAPSDVRAAISLTGQFAAVDEVLSGRENLLLMAKLRHLQNPAEATDALLERFALAEVGSRRAGRYSGGMRRRLDIAMSLVGDPPIVFLDEPTTGLDPQARLEVWRTIRALVDAGTTILLTTQYLDEAEYLADRIAILHEGTIIRTGTLAELKSLLPTAEIEYVEKQPSLEDVFLSLIEEPRLSPEPDSLPSGATPEADSGGSS